MAESDRQRLLARALALPQAEIADFVRQAPPPDVDPAQLKRIDDTALRTKLVDARLAEGLQSPKGPQKIASIIRIYPGFDAPPRASSARQAAGPPAPAPAVRGLPDVDALERLVHRYREIEADVARHLARETDDRVDELKRTLASLEGDALERAYRDLGEALERKRALASQIRFETFRRLESDETLPERRYLRFIAR